MYWFLPLRQIVDNHKCLQKKIFTVLHKFRLWPHKNVYNARRIFQSSLQYTYCYIKNKTPLNNIFTKINGYFFFRLKISQNMSKYHRRYYDKKNSAFTFEMTPVVSNYMRYVYIVVTSFWKRVEV